MTIWWKLSIIFGCLILYGAAVWHVRGWYEDSKQKKQITAQYNQLSKGQTQVLDFSQKWSQQLGQGTTACPLTPDERKLLK